MLASHTAGKSGVSCGQKALAPTHVTFHGTPAHASSAPWKGRSAMDAMLLCFHGLEILREHIEDGSRIHYTILEGTGPSNIVHERAKAHITLRSGDKRYLEQELVPRMRRIVEGACMMTDTTAHIEPRPVYWNYVSVPALSALVLDCAQEVGAPRLSREMVVSNGSTDVGNVSWCVPTVNTYVYYSDCVKTNYTYGDDGELVSKETVYRGGKGSLIFKGNTMTWEDQAEHIADGMTFTK
jgi:metal-dependent amidase/aminoacylase/carboxypeptidase family protein